MSAILAAVLNSTVARWVIGALLVLALLVGAIAWLRSDAASDAVNKVAVSAAEKEQETRYEGDAAARAAERAGAAARMRTGDY